MSMMKKGINTMPGVTIGNALRANRNAQIALDWRDEAMRAKEVAQHNYNSVVEANGYIKQQKETIKQLKARIAELQNAELQDKVAELQNKVAETEKQLAEEKRVSARQNALTKALIAQRETLLEGNKISREDLKALGEEVYDKEMEKSGYHLNK